MEQVLIQIGHNIANSVNDKYELFARFTPFILGALAVFLFGWILAELVARGIVKMASGLRLEIISKTIGLKHFLKRLRVKISPSELVAQFVKGYIMFLFFIEATKVAKLTQVADFLTEVINYVPDVMIAIFIIMIGIRIGSTMKILISTSLSFAESGSSDVLGLAAKYTVVTFAILAALAQLEIAPILVQVMFIGFISMLALGGGLAFGLGGKDIVHELLEKIKRKELKEAKKE